MTWKVLVSYLREPKGAVHNGHGSESDLVRDWPCSVVLTSDEEDDDLDNVLKRRRRKMRRQSRSLNRSHDATKNSFESLEATTATSTSSPSPQPQLTRSGSIRIGESPLHRGANLGSPAFRRKKRRARRSVQNKCLTLSFLSLISKPNERKVNASFSVHTSLYYVLRQLLGN